MATFKFTGLNKAGEKIEETREATDKFALYRDVRKEGLTVVSAQEVSKRKFNFSLFSLFGRIKMSDKIIFAKNLGAMLEAGLSLSRALSIMERQTRNKKFKAVMQSLEDSVSKGQTMSDGMAKYPKIFSSLFVSMVRAGEESGNLTNSLKIVGLQMEKSYQLQKKIKGAMIYPAIIVVLMFAISVLALIFIVPTLTATFEGLGVELPISTRVVIFISNFLINNVILVSVFAIILVTVLGFLAKSKKGKRFIEWVLLHTPIFSGMVKEINSARTARTLSSLLSSGVDVVVALSITGEVLQNSYYKDVLSKAEESVKKGVLISDIFSKYEYLYPVLVAEMIHVGEETGKLSEMLLNMAVFYENEVEQKTKDMSTIIEPFLMVFIGIGVGFFAISMLAPTYSLVDAIQ